MRAETFSNRMKQRPAHLRLKLDTEQPVELHDFVGSFTAIGNELERFAKEKYPESSVDAITYIREVRSGCIEADLSAVILPTIGTIVSAIDQVMFLEDFVKRWGSRIKALVQKDEKAEPNTKSELKDFSDTMKAIAADPVASNRIEAAVFEGSERKVRAAFTFTNADATAALSRIEDKRALLEKTEGADHRRVLMIFTRTDVHDGATNKASGDRVRIDELHKSDLAIMYASEMTRDRIKHEIREAADNVYKKGFVVDVNVRTNPKGKPVLYAVTEIHDVIDLPDDT